MRHRNFQPWPIPPDNGAGPYPVPDSDRVIGSGRIGPSNGAVRKPVYSGELYPGRTSRVHDPETRISGNRITAALREPDLPPDDSTRAARLLYVRMKIARGYYNTPSHFQELAEVLIEKLDLDQP